MKDYGCSGIMFSGAVCRTDEQQAILCDVCTRKLIEQLEAAQRALADGRLKLVRIFDESEVEEVALGEYRVKNATAKA